METIKKIHVNSLGIFNEFITVETLENIQLFIEKDIVPKSTEPHGVSTFTKTFPLETTPEYILTFAKNEAENYIKLP